MRLRMIVSYIILRILSSQGYSSTGVPLMHWYAPFYSGGGYSSEALSFVKIMATQNLSVQVTQHGDSFNSKYVQHMDSADTKLLTRFDTFTSTPGEVSICHSEPGAWHAPHPKYHTFRCPARDSAYAIGRTMFETDRLPSGWAERINSMDEVWVPTEFAAKVFKENGVVASKVMVLGEPVDTIFYRPIATRASLRSVIASFSATVLVPPEATDNAFVYLFVGKWEFRKGVQVLLSAFFAAFSTPSMPRSPPHGEDVLLVVVTSAYHSTSDFHSEIRRLLREEGIMSDKGRPGVEGAEAGGHEDLTIASLLSRIVLLSDVPQNVMPDLYNAADVLVIPSRGEGWGRPHVEAMACGTPVIATNWSGVMTYLTADNGYPLEVEQLVEARGWKGHLWAEPSARHLQELLLHVFEHRAGEVLEKGRRARKTMEDSYSFEAFGKVVRKEVQRVTAKVRGNKSAKSGRQEL